MGILPAVTMARPGQPITWEATDVAASHGGYPSGDKMLLGRHRMPSWHGAGASDVPTGPSVPVHHCAAGTLSTVAPTSRSAVRAEVRTPAQRIVVARSLPGTV